MVRIDIPINPFDFDSPNTETFYRNAIFPSGSTVYIHHGAVGEFDQTPYGRRIHYVGQGYELVGGNLQENRPLAVLSETARLQIATDEELKTPDGVKLLQDLISNRQRQEALFNPAETSGRRSVATILLELTRQTNDVLVTQGHIGEIAGIRTATVARIMSEMRTEGLLPPTRFPLRRIDREGLVRVTEEPLRRRKPI